MHVHSVFRFLRDLLGSDSAADEATQETFVRAHRQIHGLRDGERIKSWLFAIARNVSREHHRANRKVVLVEKVPERSDSSPSPEAVLLGRESDARLTRALGALPGDRRAAFLLRVDHTLGYEEIARAMGWSISKVKNEIHRARLVLRAQLTPEGRTSE